MRTRITLACEECKRRNYNLTKDYSKVKKAVDDAAAEVEKLKKEVEAVKNVATNVKTIEGLEKRLKNAQTAYDNTKKSLKDFQDVYDMMFALLNSDDGNNENGDIVEEELIDNPGVNPEVEPSPATPATADTTDDSDDDTSDDTAPADAGAAVQEVSGTIVLPARQNFANEAGPANGVLGVRVNENNAGVADQGTTQIADNQVARAAVAPVGKTDNKKNVGQKVQKMENTEVPLAAIPNMDEEAHMSWWWLLIIFLLGATGKKMYDKYMEKKKEESVKS